MTDELVTALHLTSRSPNYWASLPPHKVREAAISQFADREVTDGYEHNDDEIRFGHRGSLGVCLSGEKAGAYYDHEEGQGGYLPEPDNAEDVLASLHQEADGAALETRAQQQPDRRDERER